MKRRRLSRALLLATFTGVVAAGCVTSPPAPATESRPPNLIFLLTDDHRADALGVAGNPIIQTPQLDALARDGVRFRNAYVTSPICMISRASFLSGQYERGHGIHDFATEFSPEAFAQTYPALLRRAGYWSGFIGKYGVGNEMPVRQFDVWHGFPGQGQYETKDAQGRPIHITSLMGRQAVDFVEKAPRDRPFVLSISFKAPHVQDGDPRQFIPDSAYLGLYEDLTIPVPRKASPEYFQRLPEVLGGDSSEARIRWRLQFANPEMYQRSVKNYYRLISHVDAVVGEIREALRRSGAADNTVIVFTGDNGYFLGEHGLSHKWYGYEESIRVPLIVHDPRLPAARRGQVRDEMALNIDIAPTLLSLAGVPVPARMQGTSLIPLLHDRRVDWREDFLFEHLFTHDRIPRSDGVIGDRYKYLRYVDEQPVYEQLFDAEKDPDEVINFADRPEYAPVLERMRKRYRQLVAATGSPDVPPRISRPVP